MFPFFESICFRDGQPENLDYHQQRINETFKRFYPEKEIHRLVAILKPEQETNGLYKCRFFYGDSDFQISHEKYRIKHIDKLLLKEIGDYRYDFKYSDRHFLNQLLPGESGTEVLICRRGLLTDVSYANIALWDGEFWYTPAEPLLAGTRRAKLLDEGVLQIKDIRVEDLLLFKKISLINAMMDLGDLELKITPEVVVGLTQ